MTIWEGVYIATLPVGILGGVILAWVTAGREDAEDHPKHCTKCSLVLIHDWEEDAGLCQYCMS